MSSRIIATTRNGVGSDKRRNPRLKFTWAQLQRSKNWRVRELVCHDGKQHANIVSIKGKVRTVEVIEG